MNPRMQSPDRVEHPTPWSFAEALERVVTTVESSGLRIFARIDHAAAALQEGLQMLPATVVIYGHPRGGTPLMLACPAVALDLPLRVLVRADAEGRSYLAFHPIGPVLLRAGVPAAQAGQLARAQDILVQLLRN